MSDDAKTAIVDFILQRPISDIDTTSDDVSEKLIALECGHIFTVETLDGHCSMSEYYEIDPMTGRYLAMKAPPVKFQAPPACPTCRGPITSPRYGRVTKRANLDILEQNVASSMSKRLEKLSPSLDTITAGLEASEDAAKEIVRGDDFASEDDFAQICEEQKGLFGKPDEPLPVNMLKELEKRHGFSQKEAEAWNKITKEISRVYEMITDVASARSAHVKAYEAAMATLFKLEMEAIARDPSKIDGKTHQEAAFDAVNAKIGQPPHKADRKYHIEAFLLSIELRLMLAQIASAHVAELPVTSDEFDHVRHRQIWATFVGFLYDSCTKDCAKAISLARSCSASRQEARVSIVNLRCGFEKFRFDALGQRRKIQVSGTSGEVQLRMRKSLGALVSQQRAVTQEALLRVRTRYLQNRPVDSQKEINEEILWFRENCSTRAEKVFDAYNDLRVQVLKGEVFYQSVSTREKQDIVRALSFGMQCTHPVRLSPLLTKSVQVTPDISITARTGTLSSLLRYVECVPIPDFASTALSQCGGAMEASRCPECRAPIGGGNHRLVRSNTRAVEYEQLALEGGARGNPWAPRGHLAAGL